MGNTYCMIHRHMEVSMGWKGVTVMGQRVIFISEYLNGYFPVNEICDQFSISRKTA